MDNTKRSGLVELLGEEVVSQIESKTGSLQELLADVGIESKELDESVTAEEENEVEPEAVEETQPVETVATVELDVQGVVEDISKQLNLDGLNEFLGGLKETVEALVVQVEKLSTDDQTKLDKAVSEQYNTPNYIWQKRASNSNDNVIGDEEAQQLSEQQKGVEEQENIFNLIWDGVLD